MQLRIYQNFGKIKFLVSSLPNTKNITVTQRLVELHFFCQPVLVKGSLNGNISITFVNLRLRQKRQLAQVTKSKSSKILKRLGFLLGSRHTFLTLNQKLKTKLNIMISWKKAGRKDIFINPTYLEVITQEKRNQIH